MYRTIPSIKEKDELVTRMTESFTDSLATPTVSDLLHDLIGYYVVMEGIFFYAGFAMMLALKRQGKMIGVGEQFEFIQRDEGVHLAFGCELINTIKTEHPGVWSAGFQEEVQELVDKAVVLECQYARDACPRGLLGINAEQFAQYVQFVADRRLERIGLPTRYHALNPFPWMAQASDLGKEKNFFETTVNEYQSAGSLTWG